MTKKPSALLRTLLCVLLVLSLFASTLTALATGTDEDKSFEKFKKIFELYAEHHYLEKDREQILLDSFKSLLEQDEDLFAMLIDALLGAEDPYSRYMPPEDAEERAERKVFGGVGVSVITGDDGRIMVDRLISAHNPAAQAGIKMGDQIVAIDSIPVTGLTLPVLSELARGEIGTSVTYSIFRASTGELLEFEMERTRLIVETIHYDFDEFVNAKGEEEAYAICTIDDFEGFNTYVEFIDFKNDCLAIGVRRILIDLRRNPGGEFWVALELTNWLIPDEDRPITTLMPRDEEQATTYRSTGDGIETDMIVILVDETSASASELFAIALQELGYATVVGTQTFGKAIGQDLFEMDDKSLAFITTIQAVSPNQVKYHGIGVIPDIVVENTEIQKELPEFYPFNHDNYIEAVLAAENDVVEALHQRLSFIGVMRDASRLFGESTAEALRFYQRNMGLPVTGELDLYTFQSITDMVNSVKELKIYHDDQYDAAIALITKP